MREARAFLVRRRWYLLVPVLFGIGFATFFNTNASPATVALRVFAAALAGLAVGFVVGFIRDRLDDRLHTPFDAELATRVPVAAVIPGTVKHGVRVVSVDAQDSRAARAYRSLAYWVDERWPDSTTRIVYVTGPTPGVGASAVAANLAVAYARAGRSVVLADLNLQKPSVQRYFAVHNDRGMVALLTGSALAEVVRTVPTVPGLSVIPAGTHTGMSDGWLKTAKLGEVLDELGTMYDVCVIDGTSVVSSDPSIVTQFCDGVLLVVAAADTEAAVAAHASYTLASAQAPMLGTVLNGYRESDSGYPYEDAEHEITAAEPFSRPVRSASSARAKRAVAVDSGSTALARQEAESNKPLGWALGDEVVPHAATDRPASTTRSTDSAS